MFSSLIVDINVCYLGDAVIDDSGNMNWAIWVGIAAGSLVLVAAVIFVVIGFVIVKNKRKNSYTQVE